MSITARCGPRRGLSQDKLAPAAVRAGLLRHQLPGPRQHRLCQAAVHAGDASERGGVRHDHLGLLLRLHRVRGAVEPAADAHRRSGDADPGHGAVGHCHRLDDVRPERILVLRAAIPAGLVRGRLLPRRAAVSELLVSQPPARPGDQPVPGRDSAVRDWSAARSPARSWRAWTACWASAAGAGCS